MVKYYKIFKSIRQWPGYFELKKIPHTSPSRVCYEAPVVSIFEKINLLFCHQIICLKIVRPYIISYLIICRISYHIIIISQHIICHSILYDITSHHKFFSTEIDLPCFCCCTVLVWGLLHQFPPFHYFPNFSEWLKLWQVTHWISLSYLTNVLWWHLSDMNVINTVKRHWFKSRNVPNQESNEQRVITRTTCSILSSS